MSFWKFRNAETSGAPDDLYIDGEIVDEEDRWLYDWLGDPCASPIDFRMELKAREGKPLNVYINSPGGSVFAGIGIYDALRAHKGHVTVCVSFAASIASVIAMSGDTVEISPAGMLMIHNPTVGLWGNAGELRKAADTLDKVRDAIANAYVAATEQPREEILRMMEEETYMTAEEAVALGFADKVRDSASSGELTYMRNMVAMLCSDAIAEARKVAMKGERSEPRAEDRPKDYRKPEACVPQDAGRIKSPSVPGEDPKTGESGEKALALERQRLALKCKLI